MNKKNVTLGLVAMLVIGALFGLTALPDNKHVNVSQTSTAAWDGANWTGDYSDALNATQGVFDLYTDMGTLLGQNIGTTLSATINLFIFAIMVIMPFAVVIGIVATAVVLTRKNGRKMR